MGLKGFSLSSFISIKRLFLGVKDCCCVWQDTPDSEVLTKLTAVSEASESDFSAKVDKYFAYHHQISKVCEEIQSNIADGLHLLTYSEQVMTSSGLINIFPARYSDGPGLCKKEVIFYNLINFIEEIDVGFSVPVTVTGIVDAESGQSRLSESVMNLTLSDMHQFFYWKRYLTYTEKIIVQFKHDVGINHSERVNANTFSKWVSEDVFDSPYFGVV